MTDSTERFTLRQLPLPAKLVLTVFLISVGVGYLSAMFQLHFKHASGGNPLPGVADVVARFSGQPWPLLPPDAGQDTKVEVKPVVPVEPKEGIAGGVGPAAGLDRVPGVKIRSLIEARCTLCHMPGGEKEELALTNFEEISAVLGTQPAKSKLMKVLASGDESSWNKDNMAQAFTKKSMEGDDDWKTQIAARPDTELRKERSTERLALIAWFEAGAPESAFKTDAFALPEALAAQPLTERFKTEAVRTAPVVKTEQAGDLAGGAGDKSADLRRKAKHRQMSLESLTQSTHAHLLSFAMLWAITGFTFAFTSYPLWLRVAVAPAVLLAQVVDVCCWWLARLDGVGPYFAMAIMGTGAIVGLGLVTQIVLSLFNMYGGKGKAILLVLLLAGAAGFGLLYVNHIEPFLAAERQEAHN